MASRMDRYSKTETTTAGRSDRNKSLYKQIEDLDSYTNIAGIATIENKNSIDIEKVRELLKTREDTKEEKIERITEELKEEVEEETRHYDIKDLLSRAKEQDQEENKYRKLSVKQQKLLRELNEKNRQNKKLKEMDAEELNELVKTISNMKAVSNDEDPDDVGLLDDLKADTMVGDASSIKQIIDEEREFTEEFENTKLDNSFYTSSFGFTQKDFEELKDINHKIKKDNKFIITLLIVLIILIVLGAIFFIVK